MSQREGRTHPESLFSKELGTVLSKLRGKKSDWCVGFMISAHDTNYIEHLNTCSASRICSVNTEPSLSPPLLSFSAIPLSSVWTRLRSNTGNEM